MNETTSVAAASWEELQQIVASGNGEHLAAFLHLLAPEETAYTISRLSEEQRTAMLSMLAQVQPELAADLMEHFADEHAADMIEALSPDHAAAIVDEMDSDEQADVLGELDDEDLAAILARMDPQEAAGARERLEYPEDTAGGLMITELLSYHADQDVDDVISDLRSKAAEYVGYEVRYLYVTDRSGRFVGVVPMRDLVLAAPGRRLTELMVSSPVSVRVDAPLDRLEDLFDRVDFSAVPVLDEQDRLVGVVQRALVQEALSERSSETLLKFGGIIGGEELRTMPLLDRWPRRLAFLGPNIVLSYLAVTIIAVFEPTIERLTVLAVFLPMLANLSGAAGNQAVAVSIRELSLGLVKPGDLMSVMRKEVMIGLLNGVVIGTVLGLILLLTRHEPLMIPLLIGVAYVINSVLSVLIGGSLPLILKAMKVDPAMMSSPILTTMTDMGAFFLTLSFAALYLAAMG